MVEIDRNSDKPLTEWLLDVSCFAESQAELEMAYRHTFGLPAGFSRRMAGVVWMITEGDAAIPASTTVPESEMGPSPENRGSSSSTRGSSGKNLDLDADDLGSMDKDELVEVAQKLK